MTPQRITGTVTWIKANFYYVQCAESDETFRCTRRARLQKTGQQVMVGDHVLVEETAQKTDGSRVIVEILDRRTALERPPIANVDQVLLVFALAEPNLDPWQLSRFLVKAESTGLPLLIGLNKQDLLSAQALADWQVRLSQWGYEALFFSVTQNEGISEFAEHLSNKITIVAGPSGVGKSSLINTLIPQATMKVSAVSGKLQRGRHTTRHVELFALPQGGLLADSPGFNQPNWSILPHELGQYFPEIRQQLQQRTCQFKDCLHLQEPHCAVQREWERYGIYQKFLEEAIAYQEIQRQQKDQESQLKTKITTDGKQADEPKLARKKYRRPSRRKGNQDLKDFYEKQSLEEICDDEV